MSKMVLDASAVTAVLRREAGHDKVIPHLRGSLISAVNLAEVFCTARNYGSDPVLDELAVRTMQLEVIPFDLAHAKAVASIYSQTQGSTIGFADRAGLALGLMYNLPVLTGNQEMAENDIGVEVRLFRKRKAA